VYIVLNKCSKCSKCSKISSDLGFYLLHLPLHFLHTMVSTNHDRRATDHIDIIDADTHRHSYRLINHFRKLLFHYLQTRFTTFNYCVLVFTIIVHVIESNIPIDSGFSFFTFTTLHVLSLSLLVNPYQPDCWRFGCC